MQLSRDEFLSIIALVEKGKKSESENRQQSNFWILLRVSTRLTQFVRLRFLLKWLTHWKIVSNPRRNGKFTLPVTFVSHFWFVSRSRWFFFFLINDRAQCFSLPLSLCLSRGRKLKKSLCKWSHGTSLLIAEATVKSSLLGVLQRQRVSNVFYRKSDVGRKWVYSLNEEAQ